MSDAPATVQMIGPPTLIVYVCKGCSVWTIHRRKRCVWCNSRDAPEIVQYINEGAS